MCGWVGCNTPAPRCLLRVSSFHCLKMRGILVTVLGLESVCACVRVPEGDESECVCVHACVRVAVSLCVSGCVCAWAGFDSGRRIEKFQDPNFCRSTVTVVDVEFRNGLGNYACTIVVWA